MPRELFLKIYPPMTLLLVGFSAWFFFRQLKFNPTVCVLGGLAAGLNNHFFSVACWGTGMWNISTAMVFLSMSALSTRAIKQLWAKAILAGLAVGMAVMEGYDVGAIVSIFVGGYALVWILSDEGKMDIKIGRAALCEILLIGFALFIAVHTISTLVTTQIEGVAAMGQEEQTKVTRWNAATQWSLPKAETLQLVAPGLFGYRMRQHILSPDHSSAYWGDIGRDPRLEGMGSDNAEVRHKTAMLFNIPDELKEQLNTPSRHERTSVVGQHCQEVWNLLEIYRFRGIRRHFDFPPRVFRSRQLSPIAITLHQTRARGGCLLGNRGSVCSIGVVGPVRLSL